MPFRIGVTVAALVVVLDQLTKLLANAALIPYQPLGVLPFVNLTLSYNTGAAFSFLADQSGWQRWLFSVLAIAVAGYLLWWLRRLASPERVQAVALGLILGGAVGNVLDRLTRGYVVDFIDIYYRHWHWPAFNVADSAITVGVVLLVVNVLLDQRVRV